MDISSERLPLTKRYPLTISRGTITGSINVLVRVAHEGIVGWGEAAPNDVSGDTTHSIETDIASLADALCTMSPGDLAGVGRVLEGAGAGGASAAALDMACHDWWGRWLGHPLWRLWGLDPGRVPATSLTIGMAAPDVVRARVPEILHRTGAHALKVKLGSRDGIDVDREMFSAAREAAGTGPISWRVDANGGWSPDAALSMDRWLADRGVAYVEQPLPVAMDSELNHLVPKLRLPVFLDESIRTARDVVRVVAPVAGVNLKLMKCGGLREGRRIIEVARARNLQVMIGCMGESTLSITAGAHLAPLADHVDLDSHCNLIDDPFIGARMIDGCVVAPDGPGLGVSRRVSNDGGMP